jgi:hypothetical protein
MWQHWFSPKGIARHYPHKFRPLFPATSIALTAALTEIVLNSFDPETGAYTAIKLNEEHRKMFKKNWVRKINKMLAD